VSPGEVYSLIGPRSAPTCHNWERRAPSDRALIEARLTEKSTQLHGWSCGLYGPRIDAEPRLEHEVGVSRKRIARLMKPPVSRPSRLEAVADDDPDHGGSAGLWTWVTRVPADPHVRLDTNDDSLDPRMAGHRVETRVTQSELLAVALDTREPLARHQRSFVKHRTDHRARATPARRELRGAPAEPEVELRPATRAEHQVRALGHRMGCSRPRQRRAMGSGRAGELILEAAGSLRVAEAGDPFGRGREQHAVSGRAGTDPGRDRAVGLAGARRAGDLRPFLSPPVAVRR